MTTIKIEWGNVNQADYPNLKSDIQQATEVALSHVKGALAVLNAPETPESKALFVRFFGTDSANQKTLVEKVYSNVKSELSGTMTYVLDFQDKRDYAYTYENAQDGKLYLANAFLSAPATGKDSKYGTIIHETSHNVNDSVSDQNKTYSMEAVESLAKNFPGLAAHCAENYEYYVEQGVIQRIIS